LSDGGAALLEATLDGVEAGTLAAVPQPTEGVSYAPKVTVDSARVRWDLPAAIVDRHIRAATPAPGAWTMVGDLRLKLGPVAHTGQTLPPAAVTAGRDGVLVGTATTAVRLLEVQPPGKRPMAAADWARGARLDADTVAR
jgi:methionyl-tRNA formyltransferase